MDNIERLRKRRIPIRYGDWTDYEDDTECHEAADEIERLREDKAELVEALIDMRNHINKRDWDENVSNEAKATFAKATGERVMDIVERLRSENCMFGYYESPEIQIEAANEIEKLRKLLGLVEVKPRIRRECWVNVTPDAMWVYEDKESADHHHGMGRIACVKITIDCEEGEGL